MGYDRDLRRPAGTHRHGSGARESKRTGALRALLRQALRGEPRALHGRRAQLLDPAGAGAAPDGRLRAALGLRRLPGHARGPAVQAARHDAARRGAHGERLSFPLRDERQPDDRRRCDRPRGHRDPAAQHHKLGLQRDLEGLRAAALLAAYAGVLDPADPRAAADRRLDLALHLRFRPGPDLRHSGLRGAEPAVRPGAHLLPLDARLHPAVPSGAQPGGFSSSTPLPERWSRRFCSRS